MKVKAGAVEAVSAQARKRRMERRAKTTKASEDDDDGDVHQEAKRIRRLDDDAAHEDDDDHEEEMESLLTSSFEGKLTKDALAKIPGFKKQARYVPAVSMSKEELTMWRKEARRVRNRESAAASRQKTQKRIEELEEEVAGITKKYEAALRRIVELEAAALAANQGSNSSNLWTCSTTKKHQALQAANDGAASPVLTPHTVSPPLSPREEPFSIGGTKEEARDEWLRRSTPNANVVVSPPVATAVPFNNSTMKYQQVINTKISRPNACVKIPIRAFSVVAAV